MKCPSLTLILSGVFLAYVLHSMWSLAQLFVPPSCNKEPCFKSYLSSKPRPSLDLLAYTSESSRPSSPARAPLTLHLKDFDYDTNFNKKLDIDVPTNTRNNGTLYLQVVVAPTGKVSKTDSTLGEVLRIRDCTLLTVRLTRYAVPQLQAFNLLTEQGEQTRDVPVTHIKTRLTVMMLTGDVVLPHDGLPYELARLVRLTRDGTFLPIVQQDFLQTRTADLQPVDSNMEHASVTLQYAPCSAGWLRFVLQVEHALSQLTTLGFTTRDLDEVKRVFSETNVYLLLGTMLVGSVHLLLDFLSFKSDVAFWRATSSLAGLSHRTVMWRAFSQTVIFLYLMDEQTSLLVLIPSAVGTVIEFWKVWKVMKRRRSETEAERVTRAYDDECMRYLVYVLYPLCLAGAVYSLAYQPHRSWYSWTVNSLANGVYAFGFLFMLPQLFVNYRLKSVAALPWRAFTYRAFTTFIDDVFAFIITMPTAHRLACFRDDIVFLVYLYQRWLYPVDTSRVDDVGPIAETVPDDMEPAAAADLDTKKTQ